MLLLTVACTQEKITIEEDTMKGEATEKVSFQWISKPMIATENNGTEAISLQVDPRTAIDIDETKISNVWVFQYSSTGKELTQPKYYTITDNKILDVMLRPAIESRLVFLANTNNPTWVTKKDVSTLTKLKAQTITLSTEEQVYGGANKNLLQIAETTKDIKAGVDNPLGILTFNHLLAKIIFSYTREKDAQDLNVVQLILNKIPSIVRIGSPIGNEKFPVGDFNSSNYLPFKPIEKTNYVFYVPENRQGKSSNQIEGEKNNEAPNNAFSIKLSIESKTDGGQYAYTIFPGENVLNDFNIQRGKCYKVTIKLTSTATDERVLADPANCFVMSPESSIIFDPYVRPESGGGFYYKNYVNKNEISKKIARVDILWQTKEGEELVIGNNIDGKLVRLDNKDLVHVKTGKGNGNAVIAAYNTQNQILWSWHIWVNKNEPAKLENAVLYKTYPWDANNIYGKDSQKPRIDGYPFMSCNLGAIDNKQGSKTAMGLLYQWGRKDPFPQAASGRWDNRFLNYSNDSMLSDEQYGKIIEIFDNTGKEILISDTKNGNNKGMFNAVSTNSTTGTVEYTLLNPTTFVAAAKEIGMFAVPTDESEVHSANNYINNGGWFWVEHEDYTKSDCLWGGAPFGAEGQTILTINNKKILANNGAQPGNKSIFDPCPAGWMLPAADAWLGFTSDGLNHKGQEQLDAMNYDTTLQINKVHGLLMYMQDWKIGPTSFFPTQGWRLADGSIARGGWCGAYFTSAASPKGNAYIFHIHDTFVYPYDLNTYGYNRRAVAAAIRCVRMTK